MPHVGVLNHPQRAKIDQMILEGKGDRTVAKSVDPPLSRDTILRYRRTVVRTSLQPVSAVAKVLREHGLLTDDATPAKIHSAVGEAAGTLAKAEPFMARLAKYDAIEEAGIQETYDSKDFRSLPNMLNASTRRIELAARLSGALEANGPVVQHLSVMVVLPEVGERPQPVAVDARIIDVDPASD